MSSGFTDQHAALPTSEASRREDELRLTFMRLFVKGQASDCGHVHVCGAWRVDCGLVIFFCGWGVSGCVCVSDSEGYYVSVSVCVCVCVCVYYHI
jgi:hypothetical protein